MAALRFEWDPIKAASNRRKHGVSFEEARTVFEDAGGLIIPHPDHSADEARFIAVGLSAALKALVVMHCEREQGDVIRIISARTADRGARASYAAHRSR
ncbi:MAG: BrnT family toxin [Gemmatimonadaceae bacterium]